ncbi:NUDIX hydrolase [Candidatus Pacearchaeota archaeon]|nr:NUDIX hydrolase [Candidatus Pacearchaeota archaeon]
MAGIGQLINKEAPLNLALGVVFDTERKKVLIAKRKKQAQISGLKWCFPGGKIEYEDDLEEAIKNKIKEKTGLRVESLGSIFAETHFRNEGKMFSIYYLCELIDGKEKPSEDFEEMKWVSPGEVEDYFKTELHPSLREYLKDLG